MDAFMCYGPVVPNGYGVCYNPHEDYMFIVISSFNTSDETRSDFFAFTLESSFMQMREMCLKTNESAASNGDANRSNCVNGMNAKNADDTASGSSQSPKRTKLTRQTEAQGEVAADGCNGAGKS